MRNQLWRYYPQILELTDSVAENWIMDLWEMAPDPEQAKRLTTARIGKLLKRRRIRRIDAAEILRSIPGVGRTVLATLLTEAHDPLRRRDYPALRGSAPVTKRSGKGIIVVRRMAVHARLRNAVYHLGRGGDPVRSAEPYKVRRITHRHARALRTVADRLLAMTCAMLRDQTLYRLQRLTEQPDAA